MQRTREHAATGFLAHHGLLAAACGGAMAEAWLLAALAPAARGLAPQVTALPPLAVYHDLRWLYGYGLPWPVFSSGVAAMVAARSAVSAGLIRLAWPAGSQPPPMPTLLGSCVTLTGLTALLLSPVTALIFGTAVVPFSWPFLASLAAMLLLMLPFSHGGVRARWWQSMPPLTAIIWLLTDFAVLTATAAVAGQLPAAAAVGVAGLAGLANARAWYGVTSAVVLGRSHAPGWLPLAPIAAVSAILLVIGVTRLAFLAGVHESRPHPARTVPAGAEARAGFPAGGHTGLRRSPHGRSAVLVIAGFGSSCCSHAGDMHRVLPWWWVQQFSYRGMSKGGSPLPHGPAASNLSLTVLGNRIAAQVGHLHDETGRPVDVVAESEGALGMDAMLALHPQAPLGSVVLLSPIIAPGQDSYPSLAGADPGLVAGAELRAVIWFVGGLSPFGTAGAQTFVNSVDSVGARFATMADHRRVRELQFVPLADAVTLPGCALPANILVVPAFHGELLGDPGVLDSVRDFLTHQPVSAHRSLRTAAEILAAAAAAWRMPLLSTPSPPCLS